MRRAVAATSAVVIVLALSSMTLAKQAEKTSRTGRDKDKNVASVREPVGERQGAEQAQKAQRLQQQIEQMRADHQSLIDQLNALRATAAKEKAGQTVKQIETLISRRQTAFRESVRQLEQDQQKLQRTGRGRAARPDQAGPRIRRAPEFEMTSFDGRKVKLADYKGQIVVLEWLSPDSPYSRYHYETAQTMVKLATKYRDKGVVWLAVNSTFQTTPEVNREFAEKYKLPYPILDDRSGDLARQYGARTTPHLFIIGKDGRVAYDGAIDDAPAGQGQPSAGKVNYVDKALSELTLNRPVSLPNTPPYGTPVKYGRP